MREVYKVVIHSTPQSITRTFRGNRKRFELWRVKLYRKWPWKEMKITSSYREVRVIGSQHYYCEKDKHFPIGGIVAHTCIHNSDDYFRLDRGRTQFFQWKEALSSTRPIGKCVWCVDVPKRYLRYEVTKYKSCTQIMPSYVGRQTKGTISIFLWYQNKRPLVPRVIRSCWYQIFHKWTSPKCHVTICFFNGIWRWVFLLFRAAQQTTHQGHNRAA